MNKLTKNIAVFGTVFFAAFAAEAQNNNLVVFSETGDRFTLILNGLRQNEKPETNVKVVGLNAEWYTAKIIFEQSGTKKKPDINQKIGMMDGGSFVSNREVTYAIINKKGKLKTRWNGTAEIPQQPANDPTQVIYVFNPSGNAILQSTTTTTGINIGGVGISVGQTTTTTGGTTVVTPNGNTVVTPNGTTVVTPNGTTTTTTTTTNGMNPNQVNMGVNVDGVGVNISVGGTGMNTTTTQQTTTTTTTNGTTVITNGQQPMNNGCFYQMSPTDFNAAKSSISSKGFDDSKLTIAKQVLSTNCMSSGQVKEIMQLLSFEESKLDWAKFAYGKTVDPGNYFKLNDAFQFETSIDELNQYIQSHR